MFLKKFSTFLFCVFIFFANGTSLFAIEIILVNGEGYIGELVTEDAENLKIKFKDGLYKIPKSDIVSFDYTKKGENIGYKLSQFYLKDGSTLKGVIAEETPTNYTVQSQAGFLYLEKSKLDKVEKGGVINSAPPAIYFLSDENSTQTRIGFFTNGYATSAPLNATNPVSYGGGFFAEPEVFRLSRNWKFGLSAEYNTSPFQGSTFSFLNAFPYIQYNYRNPSKPILDFYINFGLGGSYVRYARDNTTISGLDPLAGLEVGWQGLQWSRYFVRVAAKSQVVAEDGTTIGFYGATIGIGMKL